ncbi:uncharacterized protein CPUR_08241 [Claviceps purpurea 20.1]|uniref:Uncharacterized protein n=1 Tax=Claviceps purpurea (strain 20.1) TaxID=1111077 RepID=M1WID9_CLAP2|nr:uncharacterized protein CPUR_08241 [Claviceps purpurea 20.1]
MASLKIVWSKVIIVCPRPSSLGLKFQQQAQHHINLLPPLFHLDVYYSKNDHHTDRLPQLCLFTSRLLLHI